jgi:immune inhibitor A
MQTDLEWGGIVRRTLGAVLVLAACLAVTGAGTAGAVPGSGGRLTDAPQRVADAKPKPLFARKWQQQKFAAADLVAQGNATVMPNGNVRLPNGQFVDYALEGEDHIVTLLADFTDPLHGQIPKPDRSVDNSTYWVPNFNRAHYQDELFSTGGGSTGSPSMHDYYLQQSSGRYTVVGQVSNWVHINKPESEYGANGPDGDGSDNANGAVYRVIKAGLDATAGGASGIDWSPSKVDVWDRYDCDGDGNFDEPDGYIDHFQMVHAGEGEDAGGGAQGGDAIWSHSSYANEAAAGTSGPAKCKLGGYRVPGTNLWVGDYTIEAENGGVGVFAHEFGHDLGLPDLYDTTGAAENSTSFWSIMSQGSWGSDSPNAIGDRPVHMGPWEKLVLGFLGNDITTVNAGDLNVVTLGPAEGHASVGTQVLRINLPNYIHKQTVFAPEGSDPYYYYSNQGDDLDNTMTRTLPAPLSSAKVLTFRTQYDIEEGWDYAYVEYTTNGTTWTPINGNLSTEDDPNAQNQGHGITGASGGWVNGTYTVPAGATGIRFRYWTDGAFALPGFAVDSISLGGEPADDASNTSAWTFDGFQQVQDGVIKVPAFRYFLVESRSYVRNDASLRGAYNFLFGNWLEKQPYADGVLVWLRDSGWGDNNVSLHPGHGQILPIDAHPQPTISPFGKDLNRTRWQVWDSTFGLDPHQITLHELNSKGVLRGRTYYSSPANVFYDSSPKAYWNAQIPTSSTMTPGSGVRIDILSVSADRTTYKVRVH